MAGIDPERISADDRELLEELRRVVELADPVPPNVVAAASASLTWRTIDAELAQLAYDSALDAKGAALVRTCGARRLLTFDLPGGSLEVEVTADGPIRRLLGQLVPPRAARIEIRHAAGVLAVDADELGRFAADGVAAGPASLVCRRDGRVVETEWVVV